MRRKIMRFFLLRKKKNIAYAYIDNNNKSQQKAVKTVDTGVIGKKWNNQGRTKHKKSVLNVRKYRCIL